MAFGTLFRMEEWPEGREVDGGGKDRERDRDREADRQRQRQRDRERKRASYSGPSSSDALFSMVAGILRQAEPRGRRRRTRSGSKVMKRTQKRRGQSQITW